MKKYKLLILLIILILINILVHHVWFFSMGDLFGSDWGRRFTETSRDFFTIPFIRHAHDYGGYNMTPSFYPTFLLEGALARFGLSYGLIERIIFLWPIVLVSALSSFLLVKKLTRSNKGALVGSFIFTFNTYSLYLRTAHLYLSIGFAFFPIVIFLFIKTLENKKTIYVLLCILFLYIVSAYEFRAFYILVWLLFLYYVFHNIFIDKLVLKKLIINSFLSLSVILSALIFNFYWIYTLAMLGRITNNEIVNRGIWGGAFYNVSYAFTLQQPWWTGKTIAGFINQPISPLVVLIPLTAILGVIVSKKNRIIQYFALISILGILLTKQSAHPFTNLYSYLYKNLPGFNVFREASKFYVIIMLSYSVLVGNFFKWSFQKTQKMRFYKYLIYVLYITIMGIILWNTRALITGEMKSLFIPRKAHKDYLILRSYISDQNEFFRVLQVPQSSQWGLCTHLNPCINSNLQTASNAWNLLVKDKKSIEENILKQPFVNRLFDLSSIKYIVVPIRDKKAINDDDIFYWLSQDRPYFISQLDQASFISKIDIGLDEIAIYENTGYHPKIYTTQKKESVYQNIPYKSVQHKYINATQYKIDLAGVNAPVYINFSERYNEGWQLYEGNINFIKTLINLDSYEISSIHTQNDALLNSFYIDPVKICDKSTSDFYCKKNSNGTYDISITLFFTQQKYMNQGILVSSAFGVIFIILLLFIINKSILKK